ncbi:MAG TPA: ATP-binding protein [Cellvibrio sp.]|nr:ATP-binding protein [Cellvibrio sp.]
MNSETLNLLENHITLMHKNFEGVFNEILCTTQHGRKDEIVTVIGPAGIGKSTMMKYLANYLIKQQSAGWKDDHFPPIIVEAPVAIKGEFPWRSFLEEILEKLGEPNVSSKLDLEDAETRKKQGRTSTRGKPTIGQLEQLMRLRIKSFRPVAILIDECQNTVDGIPEKDRVSNIKRLKYWANKMNTKFILFGTHTAKELLNMNEELARRVVAIYFPRYQRDSDAEVKCFAQFFYSLIKHLNISIDSKTYENFYDIYDYSLGCPGLLVSWLHKAIALCITNNSLKITTAVMKKTRYPKSTLITTEKAIKNFEAYYHKTLEDFNPNEVLADPDEQYQPDFLQQQTPPKVVKRKLKPGQQNPRYHKVHENRFE